MMNIANNSPTSTSYPPKSGPSFVPVLKKSHHFSTLSKLRTHLWIVDFLRICTISSPALFHRIRRITHLAYSPFASPLHCGARSRGSFCACPPPRPALHFLPSNLILRYSLFSSCILLQQSRYGDSRPVRKFAVRLICIAPVALERGCLSVCVAVVWLSSSISHLYLITFPSSLLAKSVSIYSILASLSSSRLRERQSGFPAE